MHLQIVNIEILYKTKTMNKNNQESNKDNIPFNN
jgi:hypothetical protein